MLVVALLLQLLVYEYWFLFVPLVALVGVSDDRQRDFVEILNKVDLKHIMISSHYQSEYCDYSVWLRWDQYQFWEVFTTDIFENVGAHVEEWS